MKHDSVSSRVTLEVDLGALERNFRRIRARVAPLGTIVVLKADAYGLGMPAVARRLVAAGAAGIATASLEEALAAQAATGGKVPVGVLGSLLPDEIAPAVRAGIRIPLSDSGEAAAVSAAAVRLKRAARCHVALDTGMSRVGLRLDEAEAAVVRFAALPGVALEGMYSHFPTANVPGDPATAAQVRAVKALAKRLAARGVRFAALHLANSDGIGLVPAACRAPFTHVRAGIGLYGLADPAANRSLGLEPVFALKAKLAQVRTVKAGSTIGYGRTWTAPRDLPVGTVAAGYADGLPLALSNRGSVLVGGAPCPVVGRICMDFATVALDQVPDARAGDECVLLGRQGGRGISVFDWASLKATHPHDILCAIGPRVRRAYAG